MSAPAWLQRPTTEALIVHAFSSLAAGVGAGMANLPSSDASVLITLQAAMIKALADHHGVRAPQTLAAELALTMGATMSGRAASQALLSQWPGYSAALNAATAAAITELVGFAAIAWFREAKWGCEAA